jgi:hypothetical protein
MFLIFLIILAITAGMQRFLQSGWESIQQKQPIFTTKLKLLYLILLDIHYSSTTYQSLLF